jgi:outer membrane protein assembly factor BamA
MMLRNNIALVSLLLIMAGCSNTRFLAENQLLYTGQEKVEIIIEHEDVKASSVKQYLQLVAGQAPNNSIFDRRILPPVGLWVYNYWDDDEQKKIRHWIYKALSKAPVLISDVNPGLRARKMENDLFDQGFFQVRAWAVVDTSARNPHKARVAYFVDVGPPYRYAKIELDSMMESVNTLLEKEDFRDQVNTGDQFSLDKLTKARDDLSREFQNQGYFYFNHNLIELDVDTALGNNQMSLAVRSKEGQPQAVLSKYTIDSIQIYISRSADSTQSMLEPVQYEGMTLYSSGDYLKLEVIKNALFFESGDQYSYTAYQNTITRLNNLGVFSFVKISFENSGTDSLLHLLNVRLDLTLADQINLSLATDAVMKSTGFFGPAISAAISHNNIFKGAEKIQIAPTGSIEWQWGQKKQDQLGMFSYELGLNSSLTFPRLMLPGSHFGTRRITNQETSVNLNFNILNRTDYYEMFSILTSYRYSWGTRNEMRHSFSPIYLNFVNLLATTPAFDTVINENIDIRKSFEEQFIIGMKYDFKYDNTYKIRAHNIYFQAGLSSSGNFLDLLKGISRNETERPYKFLNTVYSQHLKATTDFRYYLNGFNKTLAMRLYAGIGLPYLNSSVLPYVEQFFSGGAYSVRGFTARTLGPGSYHEVESSYIDQSGDMKLEANLEFRFGMTKIVKGALFLETGNIWLINEDENRPGSQFNFNTFYNQLAVGTGVGLRFDFNFFVLRTDLGFPLRTPYLQDDKNWLPGARSVLSKGLFYFAIGYPF